MATKKKQCSGTKGYSCGRSCISVKKVCRKEGLAGQSVKILNNFVKEIEDTKDSSVKVSTRPSLEEIRKMNKLGQGYFGAVYSDGKGTAYKVENLMKDFDDLHPVILINLYTLGIEELPENEAGLAAKQNSMKIQNDLAKAGYAPKAYDAWIEGKNLISTQEELQGYKTLSDDDSSFNYDKAMEIKQFMQQQGIRHQDLHTGNIMQNPKTGDIKIIDLDWAIKLGKPLTDEDSNYDWKSIY